MDDGETTIRLALAERLIAAKDVPAAREILDKILNCIPEHRHILELARELDASKT